MRMKETRYYAVLDSWKRGARVIRWGLSRFGKKHDKEMEKAVSGTTTPGDGTCFTVGFTPTEPRMKSATAIQRQRIGNMKRRIQKNMPLFAAVEEKKELERSYYSLEDIDKSQLERKKYLKKCEREFWENHKPELQVKLT